MTITCRPIRRTRYNCWRNSSPKAPTLRWVNLCQVKPCSNVMSALAVASDFKYRFYGNKWLCSHLTFAFSRTECKVQRKMQTQMLRVNRPLWWIHIKRLHCGLHSLVSLESMKPQNSVLETGASKDPSLKFCTWTLCGAWSFSWGLGEEQGHLVTCLSIQIELMDLIRTQDTYIIDKMSKKWKNK